MQKQCYSNLLDRNIEVAVTIIRICVLKTLGYQYYKVKNV